VNEVVKTAIYIGTGCFFALVAFLMRPSDAEFSLDNIERQVNTPLFPQFTDPGEATSLEVVRVDEVMGRLERFKVARDTATGQWTIPSHNGYPADAEDQMRRTSVAFIDLPIIGIASTVSEEHELFGVVQPDERTAETADGVGLLVSIENQSGEGLAQLIVGKSVRGAENQRFVRRPGQDVVYVVEISPDNFSTRFEDWIERDLLQLNAFDIDSVRLEDYTVGGVVRNNSLVPDQQQRMEADLKWDSTGGKWSLERLVSFQDRQPRDDSLAEDQELNTTKLNDLKDAVAGLEIANVFRKPAGLGANLRTDESFMQDMEALQSLVDKGFYPMRRGAGGDFELRAANGEVRIGTTEGVEYVLRFGNTAGTQQDDPDKMNRFLFVTARFDESKFPMPERPTLPSTGVPAEADTDAASSPEPSDEEADPIEPADDESAEVPSETDEGSDEPVDADPGDSGDATPESPTEGENGEDASSEPADSASDEEPESSCAPWQEEEENDTEVTSSNDAVAEDADGTNGESEAELEDEETASLRQQLEAEYQRQLDDREEKIENGRARVRELNDRFADWYYVISEDYFKRIHLSRADLVRPKGSGGEESPLGPGFPGGFNLPDGLQLPGDLDLPGLDGLDDLDGLDLDSLEPDDLESRLELPAEGEERPVPADVDESSETDLPDLESSLESRDDGPSDADEPSSLDEVESEK
jgi:hypothetical protein